MIQDLWSRLILVKIQPIYLMIIILFMPCLTLLAIGISLAFGYSSEQFFLAKSLSVMKGWSILGIFVPLVLAPLIEEFRWRGFGVDSLRSHFNLFVTSVLFGALWALWHLPLFFVKGCYQNQFLKLFEYILFHSMINLSAMLFRTEPLTKCIVTVLLCLMLAFIVIQNKASFFEKHFTLHSNETTR